MGQPLAMIIMSGNKAWKKKKSQKWPFNKLYFILNLTSVNKAFQTSRAKKRKLLSFLKLYIISLIWSFIYQEQKTKELKKIYFIRVERDVESLMFGSF